LVKFNGREPKHDLSRVFNFNLGCFASKETIFFIYKTTSANRKLDQYTDGVTAFSITILSMMKPRKTAISIMTQHNNALHNDDLLRDAQYSNTKKWLSV
jgi:hypothetical protein